MGKILDGLFGRKEPQGLALPVVEGKVKIVEIGSSGTENFAGYLSEEYLEDLRGTDAAEVYDKMRRSDPKVKMICSAMKNPIKAATWEVSLLEGIDAEDPDAIAQQELIRHILFNDLGGKTWDSFLQEALSIIEFGFALFEKTYKPVIGHSKFGSYNGIKSVAFRKQKTIEKWNLNQANGQLKSVSQFAYGDAQKVTEIAAQYLLHFALEQEGDNFEGMSVLRPCYGPWLRKNQFLKLIAAGINNYAMGIPILDVPPGEEASAQYLKAVAALKSYVTGRAAYLTKPKGWDLTIQANPFDAEKIRKVVNEENIEMVGAALANFLELGQSATGSYSLSFDLSDFFLGGLEAVAKKICETINKDLIKELVWMNFGVAPKVRITCSGISDKAGEELSKVLLNLKGAGLITPDETLEKTLRKRFGLPDKEIVKEEIIPTVVPGQTATPKEEVAPIDTSFNGSQVTSMIEVVTKFKEGVLDQSSAIEIIMAAFKLSRDQASAIVGEPLKKAPIDIEAEAKANAGTTVPGKSLSLSEEETVAEGIPEKDPVVKIIDEGSLGLANVFKGGLKEISLAMINQIEEQWKKGGEEKFKPLDLSNALAVKTYQLDLTEAMKNVYNASTEKVSTELKAPKVITLADDPKRIALARLNADVMNLSNVQINDLIKTLQLTYAQNLEAAQTSEEIIGVLGEAVDKFLSGPLSTVGADIQSSKIVNDARRDFFKDNTEQVISYTWVNGDPVSDICQFLDGKTIPADSPDVDRYWPPLHHNCKTFVVANTAETKENPDPQNSFDVPEEIAASMTLSDLRGKKLTRVQTRRRIK